MDPFDFAMVFHIGDDDVFEVTALLKKGKQLNDYELDRMTGVEQKRWRQMVCGEVRVPQ